MLTLGELARIGAVGSRQVEVRAPLARLFVHDRAADLVDDEFTVGRRHDRPYTIDLEGQLGGPLVATLGLEPGHEDHECEDQDDCGRGERSMHEHGGLRVGFGVVWS